jgi:hypothetical protein
VWGPRGRARFLSTGYNHSLLGGLAQLGERLLCKQDVRGSSPLSSTTIWFGKGRSFFGWSAFCF